MAFTGIPVVEKVSDRKFRITGVSLVGDASGTIGFAGETVAAGAEIVAPEWGAYRNAEGDLISLADAVSVTINPTTDVGAAVPISVTKGGTDQSDFKVTLHNDTAAEGGTTSAELEIYVEFH